MQESMVLKYSPKTEAIHINNPNPMPAVSAAEFPNDRNDIARRKADFLTAYAQGGEIDEALLNGGVSKRTLKRYLLDGNFAEKFYSICGYLKSMAVSEAMDIMQNGIKDSDRLSAIKIILGLTDKGERIVPAKVVNAQVNIIQSINALTTTPVGREIHKAIIEIQGSVDVDDSEPSPG